MPISTKASKVTLPMPNPGVATVLEFLQKKFARISPEEWLQRVKEGKVHWLNGDSISVDTPYREQGQVCYYREVQSEPTIPFKEIVVYEDDNILIVHKPHFLPIMAGGAFVNECLQARLQKQTANNDLQAMHRLDRMTAGLVLFSKHEAGRAVYHALFTQGNIDKTYLAVASVAAQPCLLGQSWQVKNRLSKRKQPGFLMEITNGDANSHSEIRCIAQSDSKALFELKPITGKTHQLRLHMLSLDMPILNDNFYPKLREAEVDDFSQPLQLLAKKLAFIDPISGRAISVESPESLLEWL